ncbi:MAG TPA: alanine racemase [Candidatus Acidoferrum sp.]|nr:alanine racemase [Candidatus Acidoferrum sp.]
MTDHSFPFSLEFVDTPAILIERPVLNDNVARMQQHASQCGVKLRPHIKTHKSVQLTRLQLEAGAVGIAVAKITEAEVMARAGVNDIQIANQVVGPMKAAKLLELSRIVNVSCAVDSFQNASELSNLFTRQGRQLDVLVEVDTGLHRCGLSDISAIVTLCQQIVMLRGLRLIGVMTHAGHAYGARSLDELAEIGRQEGKFLVEAAGVIRDAGITVDTVSVGSTPTASYAAAVEGVTELRVGNYIFNDRMQLALGVATNDQCALSVLATVISVPAADRAVIDAGSKVFSSDAGAHGRASLVGFGLILGKKATVTRLSEEHGVIESTPGLFRLGEKVRIIPNHACAVMNQLDFAYLVDSGQVVDRISIDARGMVA